MKDIKWLETTKAEFIEFELDLFKLEYKFKPDFDQVNVVIVDTGEIKRYGVEELNGIYYITTNISKWC